MAAQREAIAGACATRGYELLEVFEDAGWSGKSLDRPGLRCALEMLDTGEADALVVSKLDRLSRSLVDFAGLMERARRRGWALVAIDLGLDMTTPAGELVANVMASVAQWERRTISQRTKDALAVKRSQGVRLGRPRTMSDDLVTRIVAERRSGATLQQVCDRLTADGVPTVRGGTAWHPTVIRKVLLAAGAG
jgi:DNA invertase Pin-like site-specific DNA recombinase